MKRLLNQLIIGSTAVLAATAAFSQTTPTPQPSAWDQWVKQTKNPTDWLSWGGDLRLRNEYFNNALSLSDASPVHEQDYFRYRGRVWTSIAPSTNFAFNARLAAEPRTWVKPSYAATYGPNSGTEWRYGIVDNLNVKWANAFDQPLTMTVGRQDVMLGDPLNWWLVADGTPGDGSWTFFLDSARATFDAKDINTKFDLLYIYQTAHPDEWLPTIDQPSLNGTDYQLTEQNEQGVVVYASNKSIKNTQIDAYFIYKHDDQETFERAEITGLPGDNADIYTFGAKITGTPAEHWSYSLEGAYQFGSKQDPTVTFPVNVGGERRDISAYGANGKASYLFKDKLNNQVSLIGELLSGDDPDTTGTDEMFDVLWGRWPRWSEAYIYSYAFETGGRIAQLNNVGRIGAQWTLSPMKGMTASAAYTALFAPEAVPTRRIAPAAGAFSYDGNFRGHFLQTVLKHQFNKHVSAHLWGEFIWEGDYYAEKELITFLRAELMFTF